MFFPQSGSGDVPLLSYGNKMLHKLLWELGKSLGGAKGGWWKFLHWLRRRGQRLLHPPFLLRSCSLGPGSFHVSPFPAAGHPDDPGRDMFFICWISHLRSSRGYWPVQGAKTGRCIKNDKVEFISVLLWHFWCSLELSCAAKLQL